MPLAAYEALADTLMNPRHVFTEVPLTAKIVESMRQVGRAEVPDMPDRIIAATAVYLDVPVISRDGKISGSKLGAIW